MNILKSILTRIIADCKSYKLPLFILILYLGATQLVFHASCPSVILLGLPCPACGLTRAGLLLLTGKFAAAAACNPTIYLWGTFLLYCFIFRYILNRQPAHCLLLATTIGIATIIYFLYAVTRGQVVPVGYSGILHYIFSFAS